MAMNAANLGVGITIRAIDRATSTFKSIRTGFASFRKGFAARTEIKDPMMAGIFRGALGSGLRKFGDAFSGLGKRVLESTSDIRTAFRIVKSATGASADELRRLQGLAGSRTVAEMGVTANEAAAAMGQLARETNNAADAEKFLIPALKFSKMTQQDSIAGSAQLTDLMSIFSLKADDAAGVTDKLAWGMKQFNLVGSEVFDIFRGAASGANLAGQSMEDTMLAVGMMKKVFPDATRAAMSANTALTQLAGDKTQKELKKLGISVKDEATGKIRGLGDIVREVAEKTATMTEAQKANTLASAFGGRAAGGMAIIMEQLDKGFTDANGTVLKGADAMIYLQGQMKATTGEADKMAAAAVGSSDKLKAAQSRLSLIFMDAANDMRKLVRVPVTAFLNGLGDALGAIPPGARKLLLGISTGIGAVVKVIGGMIIASAVMRAFGLSFIGIAWSAVKLIAVFAILAPLVGGLAIGFYALYRAARQNVGGVADSWDEMKRKIKLGWTATIEMISSGKLSRSLNRELHKAKNEGVLKFVDMVGRARERILVFWKGMLAGIDEGAKKLGPQIEMLKQKFGWLIDIFKGEAFKDPLGQYEEAGRKAGVSLAGLGKTAADVLGKIGDIGRSIFDAVSNLTQEDIQNAIQDFVWKAEDLAIAFNDVLSVLGPIGEALSFVGDIISTIWHLVKGVVVNTYNLVQMLRGKTSKGEFVAAAATEINAVGNIWGDRFGSDEWNMERKRSRETELNAYKTGNMKYEPKGLDSLYNLHGKSYGELTQGERDRLEYVLRDVQSDIRKLGQRPVKVDVSLDGKKVGEGVQGAGDDEGARDLGGTRGTKTFGGGAPAPAAGR
jgi:TP901 family phage tail tape measure protein